MVQESPYSAYVTIRKRFRKDAQQFSQPDFNKVSEADVLKRDLDSLKISYDTIIDQNKNLNENYETSVAECEELHLKVNEFEQIIENLHSKLKKAETEKIENQEKKSLQTKNEKVIAENKLLRNERDNLKTEVNNLNVALKSSRKDLKDAHHRFEKSKEESETKIKDLIEFKIMKNSDEKELRSKQKKVEKKMKKVEEKEAQLKVDRFNFERSTNEKVDGDNHNFKPNICSSPTRKPCKTPTPMSSPPRVSFTPPIPSHTPPSTELLQSPKSTLSSVTATAADSPRSETKCSELDAESLDKLLGQIFAKEKARRAAQFESFKNS